MENPIIDFLYLISIVLFIIGLKKQSHPDTAKTGNLIAAAGMLTAIIITMAIPMENTANNYGWIIGGFAVGGIIGYLAAKRVKMTAMPEMVSIFNGFGGASSMLIAAVEFYKLPPETTMMSTQVLIILFALLVGSVAFTGSMVAWGKLDGFFRDTVVLPKPQIINLTLLFTVVGLSVYIMMGDQPDFIMFSALIGISLIYGITFVMPIGGGDMPVVISLLNSFTGIAAAGAGLIYGNQVMIVGGILVGAAGTFLTLLMCNAMNRSLLNVVIGGFGGGGSSSSGSGREEVVKEATHADLAIQLKYSNKVIIVPGYGLAVAQAQHACHELEALLENEGVEVKYAIHPVAGRMPGHMNVLLAEADVPYPKLLELDDANDQFPSTDIVLVIGANDVVNPAALDDPDSPIYGMPILKVETAKNVIVMKRSMNPGYAGIQNPLFFGDKTRMLFGDAKDSLNKLKAEAINA